SLGTGDGQGDGSLRRIEAAKFRARSSAAESSNGACGVKAVLLVPGRNRVADLVGDFDAHVKREHQVLSAAAPGLAQREGRRKSRPGHMKGRPGVVKIIGVDGDSIGQRRKAGMNFHFSSND